MVAERRESLIAGIVRIRYEHTMTHLPSDSSPSLFGRYPQRSVLHQLNLLGGVKKCLFCLFKKCYSFVLLLKALEQVFRNEVLEQVSREKTDFESGYEWF